MKTEKPNNFVFGSNGRNFDDSILQEQILQTNDRHNNFEHFVQFYEADDSLIDSLCDFTGTALNADESVVIVASETHRKHLSKRLHNIGLDVSAAHLSDRFLVLDAAETLSAFMVEGRPEPLHFNRVVGNILTNAAKDGRKVRVFGEMVALLFAEGNHGGALSLENLWNDLSKTHPFSLFCAYPMHSFDGEPLAGVLNDVCAGHSRVIPAESYTEITETDSRNRAVVELQRKARRLEKEIAERKRIEQERLKLLASEKAARIRAEEASRMKDEFLAKVSHELRTPLNAIIGWSHLLAGNRLDEATTAQAVKAIAQNARAQAQLIEDLLDVSRVIAGKLELKIQPVDIAAMMNSAIDSVRPEADSKNVRIELAIDGSNYEVFGDPTRLQQILWNLLSNALKFTPSGGRIEVGIERDADAVRISISDTGKGIDADFLPFIFDSFSQGDCSNTRKDGGLGLGLAIASYLVELHGGTICAESEGAEKGATFIVRLPRISGKNAGGRKKKAAVSAAKSFKI